MKDYRCKSAKVYVLKDFPNRYLLTYTGRSDAHVGYFDVYVLPSEVKYTALGYPFDRVKKVSINDLTGEQRRVYDSNPSKFRC